MLKVRNRLLVAWVLLAVVTCACLCADAEARSFQPGSASAFRIKPGARTNTGEPDVGDSGRNNQPPSGQSGPGAVSVPTPTGYRWIIVVWVSRYSGVDW